MVAEIVTEVVLDTVLVVTVKVALVFPAGTVTLAGTVATEVRLLDNETTAPPAGAGPDKVTVPVEGVLPFTVVGFSESALRTGALTVRVAECEVPAVAMIASEVLLATGFVVTVNVAVVAFAATVTLPGTCATAGLALERMTTVPPDGAGPLSVTVPVDELPPVRDAGLRETVLSVGAVTVSVAVLATT